MAAKFDDLLAERTKEMRVKMHWRCDEPHAQRAGTAAAFKSAAEATRDAAKQSKRFHGSYFPMRSQLRRSYAHQLAANVH
jgi:hypothetical protein